MTKDSREERRINQDLDRCLITLRLSCFSVAKYAVAGATEQHEFGKMTLHVCCKSVSSLGSTQANSPLTHVSASDGLLFQQGLFFNRDGRADSVSDRPV